MIDGKEAEATVFFGVHPAAATLLQTLAIRFLDVLGIEVSGLRFGMSV